MRLRGLVHGAAALAGYAEVFERAGHLERLEAFASLNGPAFYGLAPNEERITLTRQPAPIPSTIDVSSEGAIVPFRAGESVMWTVSPAD